MKKLYLGIILGAVLLAGGVFAFLLYSVQIHNTGSETQADEGSIDGITWVTLPASVDRPLDIGSETEYYIQSRNLANRPVMRTLVVTNPDGNLTTSFVCDPSNGQYYVETIGDVMTVKYIVNPSSVYNVTINSILSFDAVDPYDANQTVDMSRNEVDSSVAWIAC